MRSSWVWAGVWACMASGCSDDGKATDAGTETTGTSTGDGDGDPTGDGDGDGDPTTGDGDGDGDPTTGDGDGDPSAECSSVADCEVIEDCCNCEAVPIGQQLPCDQPECPGTACGLAGTPGEAACLIGSCVIAPLNCNIADATCEIEPPPPCEIGLVQSVSGSCYGACVPASACETLPFECDASSCGDGFACVTTQAGATSRCIPLPESCDGVVGCDCVSAWWIEVCDGSCSENDGTLLCENGG